MLIKRRKRPKAIIMERALRLMIQTFWLKLTKNYKLLYSPMSDELSHIPNQGCRIRTSLARISGCSSPLLSTEAGVCIYSTLSTGSSDC